MISILSLSLSLSLSLFFGKAVGLQRPNSNPISKWNPTMVIFIGITEIIVWCIFQNSYHMETLQIICNFFSNAAVIV